MSFNPKPGDTYDDLTNEAYHAGPGMSSTFLRTALRKSPWYAHEQRLRGHVETDSLRFGTMIHTALLEPDTLDARYVFAPGLKLNTTAGKEAMAALEAEAAATGRQVLREDPASIKQIQADFHSHPAIKAIWKREIIVERSIYWEREGSLCKARPDGYILDWSKAHGLAFDLKSSQSCLMPSFAKSVARYGYGQQAAQYRDGLQELHGKPFHFAWIVVESKPPHEVSVLFADEWLPHGEIDYRKALELVARCELTGTYSRAYGGKVVVCDMPSWALTDGGIDE